MAKGETGYVVKLIVCEDLESIATVAAARIIDDLRTTPDLVIGLPTGRTPRPVYRKLVAAHRAHDVSFRRATLFSIDEYVGLGPDHPASFAVYMREKLLSHVDADPARVHLPDGRAADPDAEAARHEALIGEAGGLDLLLLGVGANGHIGFNEPGGATDTATHVVDLAPETLAANRSDLPDGELPGRAITMGLATIAAARSILLLASGPTKIEPIRQLLGDGSVGDWPVAALRDHGDLTVLTDFTP